MIILIKVIFTNKSNDKSSEIISPDKIYYLFVLEKYPSTHNDDISLQHFFIIYYEKYFYYSLYSSEIS